MTREARPRNWASTFRHWIKFNAVGAVGIGVQLAVLTLLTTALDVRYLLATALAVEAAVLHNFVWHERWTWSDRLRHERSSLRSRLARLARFNLTTGVISIGGNLVLMRLLVGGLRLPVFVANVLAIAACSLVNFLVSDRFVFRLALVPAREPQPDPAEGS